METFEVIVFMAAFTFFPTFLAYLRKHPNLRTIFFFNLFLGFGWGLFATYYYALSKRKPGLGAWITFFILNAILMAIAIPGVLSARRHANDDLAREHLTALSSTLENYANDHGGKYPPDLISLTSFASEPVSDLCQKQTARYYYDCSFSAEGYRVIASPESDDYGNLTYTLTTGGVLSEDWFNEYMEDKTTLLSEKGDSP